MFPLILLKYLSILSNFLMYDLDEFSFGNIGGTTCKCLCSATTDKQRSSSERWVLFKERER